MAPEIAPYIDFHTHRRMGGDRIEVLNVDVSSVAAGELDAVFDAPFSVGIHPWNVAADYAINDAAIARLLAVIEKRRGRNLVAVGECGLDYVSVVDRNAQYVLFVEQIKIAQRYSLPVVLHCVRAFNEVMSALSATGVERAVFHSFIGSVQQAEWATAKGYLCSFSPRSLASSRTCETVKRIAPTALLVESDDSAMTIEEIYVAVAALRSCAVEEIKEIVNDNYKRLINNDK